ncbi:MAG: peptidase [Gammaproteobacteria bacterium]|nr:MAG: peptidase [Gammaproteobacteria bacterium]
MAITRSLRLLIVLILIVAASVAGGLATVRLVLEPDLPAVDTLRDVRLQVPLRVYSREGQLIAEFGEKRRIPVTIDQIPPQLIQAFLAAEDDRFYDHPGVDYQGLLRAGFELIRTGEKRQGGSTITMQVARNFFLSREKTYLRKLNEILLALKIERQLSKQEILELYLNKIYLGQRAYGIGAAAQIFYGKTIEALSLAEMATIAGLPKAPSRDNPVTNPVRARERRNYVLGRMHKLGFITDDVLAEARHAEETASLHGLPVEVEAPYVAEMVRMEMIERFGDAAYTEGLNVYSTLDAAHQQLANRAVRQALIEYDQRHGYRGPELRPTNDEPLPALATVTSFGGLLPARVTALDETAITLEIKDHGPGVVEADGWQWARPWRSENRRGKKPATPGEVVAVGDLVRAMLDSEGRWRLSQVPEIEGAFVALRPDDGAITALVGGFDFRRSKFNRALQAQRQPGSGFKPVIYSAALEKGFTTASLINDAPVVFDDPSLEATWRPENYSGKFFGPTRLRLALTKSRNLVSIRLLQATGIDYAVEYATRFGLDAERLPRNLSLALGSASLTPLEIVTVYAILANGGYRITPYFIDRIEGGNGKLLEQSTPDYACRSCPEPTPETAPADTSTEPAEPSIEEGAPEQMPPPSSAATLPATPDTDPQPPPQQSKPAPRVLEPRNVYLMHSLLRDVVRYGTGRRALALGRHDLAGKTGTTNDQRDAWFNGFNTTIAASAWVGFDDFSPLGSRETGGRAALPIWMKFMRGALDGVPESTLAEPAGLVRVRIDPETGLLAAPGQSTAIFELFRSENLPKAPAAGTTTQPGTGGPTVTPEQLF